MSELERAWSVEKTTIRAHARCLVRLPSDQLKIVELRPGGSISLGKFGAFFVDDVLGHKYGQTFEIVDDKKVIPVPGMTYTGSKDAEDDTAAAESADSAVADDLIRLALKSGVNNQEIQDLGAEVQKLSNADIEEMKKQGSSGQIGQAIIDKIIQGHDSFEKKTVFSQQKYLKRKQQKFLRRFTIDYLGASQVLQYYYGKDPGRVLDLSEESLGIMMNYANIMPGGNYLLVDETGGVILYAMLERMQGKGRVTVVHENEHPNHIVLNNSIFSAEAVDDMVKTINILNFFEPEVVVPWKELPEEEIEEYKPSKKQTYFRRKKRALELQTVVEIVKKGNFDGMIYASTLSPSTAVPRFIEKIGGSRPIVVYSPYIEVVSELSHTVSKDLRVLAPSIIATRVRPYQTIPGRIHPLMSMRGGGGYVFWGTRVFPKEGITAIGRGRKKKKLNSEEPVEV
ncbi:unnamed protein product [Kuraishia capsulata CBS 1993]|uniref:tRNA (adenine(58)-N(1))-methyltransferase non-catalytic subunit TRM6 n=1 Tax=Kuraishia capsulata CBS 1993 TaxID=1382522 RepID=W6MTC7_9ASCO|nr:uncharacterized protein KUCA_T00005666001 [Kuraishia capsulata CBS 1993]CDK29673.1 unnamed protein product [Kuraishia capsulata CBS 1993]